MKSIRLILKGGLGNQLLQYFAAENLSKQTGRDLVLDLSWFVQKGNRNGLLDVRHYELNNYDFSQHLPTESELSWKNSIYTERLIKVLPKKLSTLLGIFEEPSQNLSISLSRRQITIFGHWVNEPIVPESVQLRNLLIDGISRKSAEYLRLSEDVQRDRVISVHMRLGDYEKFSYQYAIRDPNYFVNAVQTVKHKFNEKHLKFWIFSDNPKKASQILSNIVEPDLVFDEKLNLSVSEELALLSKSSAIICSNSTFSWWAAKMSNENSIVIFPREYMRGIEFSQTGLYSKNWTYL